MAPHQFPQLRRRKAIFRTLRSGTQYRGKAIDLVLALAALVLVGIALAVRCWPN